MVDRPFLYDRHFSAASSFQIGVSSWRISASPRKAWPSLTFDHPFTLDIGPEQLHLLPQAPAHTDGDVAVFLSSANVLVAGDLFTHRSYPVIDGSSGGSLRGMIEAVERLLPMIDGDTVVVPGHGAVTNRTGLAAFLDMLRSIEDRILVLIEAQREIPAITAARCIRSLIGARGPQACSST